MLETYLNSMNIEGYNDTIFEMISNLTIKRKALSLFPLGYTIYHL